MKHYFAIAALALLAAACGRPPLTYNVENSGTFPEGLEMPSIENLSPVEALPDPLLTMSGKKVRSFKAWESRRGELLAQIQHYETGTKPSTDKSCVSARMEDSTLVVTVTVGERSLEMHCNVVLPKNKKFSGPYPVLIGVSSPSGSLPKDIFTSRGVAMVSFPFWEVMEHTQVRGRQPINALYPDLEYIGAYAAWPWGVSRLIDALEQLAPQLNLDLSHIGVTGCSFAGKMALFAGAFDERIALTIAQEPGGGGAAAWRVSETLGEVETVGRTNYSWFIEDMRAFSEKNVSRLPVDHHELCALVAPRALLVIGNPDYPWLADEAGYVSCRAALNVWEKFGIADRFGYTFQAKHMHCMLPDEQRVEVEAFVDKFLLGDESADTEVRTAPMFENVDLSKWINW